MTIAVAQVLAKVRLTLIDPAGARWSDGELLGWLSDALLTILTVKPDVFNRTSTETMAVGTKQVLPDPTFMLLGVFCNINLDGTRGRAVRLVSREALEAQNPNWHAAPRTRVVQNYIYDPSMLTSFYIYPPNDGSGRIEVNAAMTPPTVTSPDEILAGIDAIYTIPVTDYVLARAYLKDTDAVLAQSMSATYFNLFTQFLGGAGQAETASDLNLGLRPGDKGA